MWRCDLDKPCRQFCESKDNQDFCGMRAKMLRNQMKISEQLLNKILGIKEARNIKISIDDTILTCTYLHLDSGHLIKDAAAINIYELAYKCKAWAHKKKSISIKSFISGHVSIADISGADILDKRFIANTEVEVIIEACEWIITQE